MKLLKCLSALVALLLPVAAYAQTLNAGWQQPFLNITATNQLSGLTTGYGAPFAAIGASFTQNPLIQGGLYDITTASVNTPTVIVASASGRQIIPLGAAINIMASGTAAGATSISLVCTSNGVAPFQNVIATFPVAALVDQKAVTPFMVASAVSYGSAITRGCPVGQAIVASTTGSALTTTTDLFLQFPYIVQ